MHNQINHIKRQYVQNQTDQDNPEMKTDQSSEALSDQMKKRFTKSFLDIVILQMIKEMPTWGYDIIKKTETQYKVKLRHSALYPMLNELEAKGLAKSRRELQKGRIRKVYEITAGGTRLLTAYYDLIKQHLPDKTIK